MPLPQPAMLPAADRRRCPERVRLALAVAQEALEASGLGATEVATVFASSDDDGQLTHATLESLSQPQPSTSPTRFQNSVHNAAAGYWSIATGSQQPSSSISAYDWTFAAGLLDAITQIVVEQRSVLLVACDLPFPAPLQALRPMTLGLAVALLLQPPGFPGGIAKLRIHVEPERSEQTNEASIPEELRATPAARALPLLAMIAKHSAGSTRIAYLDGRDLVVELA